MLQKTVVMLFILISLLGAGTAQDQMLIVQDSKPRAVIVVPENARRAESYAAAELQKYLAQISGAQLEIVPENLLNIDPSNGPDSSLIFIGKTKASARVLNMLRRRDADAFIVKIERQQIGIVIGQGQWDDRPGTWHDLFLAGKEDRGTVYAVYDFLEQELGCRWLAPDEHWEEIPTLTSIAVPVKTRIEEPAFKYRQDNSLDRTDWGMKHKANVCRIVHFPFSWMDERYQEARLLPFELRAWESVHGASRLAWGVSRANPEWFALNENDERTINGATDRHKGQICFSNPELHDLLAERLSQLFRERPELECMEIGCDDGLPRNYCRCDTCLDWDALAAPEKQGSYQGGHTYRWLRLVNEVARRLLETDPEKTLIAAAYSSYQEPPDPNTIQPAENVIIMYWTWANCRVHGYAHIEEDENRLPEMISHSAARGWIEEWEKMTPAGMFVSEYVSRSSMDGMAPSNPRRFIKDISWLKEHGFVGYNAFDGPNPWGLQIINRYVIAKALWKTDLDADALIKDFCDHAFHSASEDVQKFISEIEKAMQMAGCSHVSATSWMTPANLALVKCHLEAAQAAVATDTTAALRLRELVWHFNYMELAGQAYELWFRVVKGERNPELMREAIKLGEAALAYKQEMETQNPDARFYVGWGMQRQVRKNTAWVRLLKQLEVESQKQ